MTVCGTHPLPSCPVGLFHPTLHCELTVPPLQGSCTGYHLLCSLYLYENSNGPETESYRDLSLFVLSLVTRECGKLPGHPGKGDHPGLSLPLHSLFSFPDSSHKYTDMMQHLKRLYPRAKRAQQLRADIPLAEFPSLVLSTRVGWLPTACNSSFRGFVASFWRLQALYSSEHTSLPLHKIKNQSLKKDLHRSLILFSHCFHLVFHLFIFCSHWDKTLGKTFLLKLPSSLLSLDSTHQFSNVFSRQSHQSLLHHMFI